MPPPEQSPAEAWTVGRIIEWTTQHLKKHGSEAPRLEAEILLAHARNCPRIQLYVDYAAPLTDDQRAAMRDLVRRRAQSEPVAYLVGRREFFGLEFRVTPDVLIPRPETETLVLEVVTEGRKCGARSAERGSGSAIGHPSILDVGTGSGCIAVACAVSLPEASVTAIDISPAAVAVARGNAAKHSVGERIRFLEGDLFAPLAADERFDFIVSNPPYVAEGEMDSLPADVRQHEPALALRAGPRGLDVIERLIAGAAAHLNPAGTLLFEISPEQADAASELLTPAGYEPPRILKDAAGRPRVIVARRA